MSPEVQMMSYVHDAIWDTTYAKAGSEYRTERLHNQLLKAARAPHTPAPVKKQPLTSSEIRAQVAARTK